MTKNMVTLSVEFYFKGEKFSPSKRIDLDEPMSLSGCLPDFHAIIAAEGNIDLYSYEYEMMLVEDIKATRAEGLAVNYVLDGALDIAAFEQAWNQQHEISALEKIAKQHMSIDELNQHPKLKMALLAAYKLGKSEASLGTSDN